MENFLVYSSRLVENDNVLDVLYHIEKFLEENGFYSDLISCKEKIWHLSGDDTKLKEMALLYKEKEKNYDLSYLINMLYLFRTQKDIYQAIVSDLVNKGYNNLNPEFDENTDKFSELWKIADRYCALKYILIYLYSRKKYKEIEDLIFSFKQIKTQAEEYCKNNTDVDINDMNHIKETDGDISYMLSSNSETLVLNQLAIDFDKNNERAYCNILDFYITNDNIDKALEFYNDIYRKTFEKEKVYSKAGVIWELSNIEYSNGNFYKSLCLQKKAIDYEIEQGTPGDNNLCQNSQ